jgi:hypothetical protein
MKNELKAISEVYTKIYESGSIGETSDHKQTMVNVASEIAAIATRLQSLKVRKDDGDRLLELARKIENEYNEQL